jgi:hypothetical protein
MKPRGYFLVLALLLASNGVWAGTAAKEQAQRKIVSRFYQATDGMLEYCRGVPEAQWLAHAATVRAFWLKYPEFGKRLRDSPYYPAAVASQAQAQTAELSGMDPHFHSNECGYYQQLIQEYLDDPDGDLQAEVREMTETLAGPAAADGA